MTHDHVHDRGHSSHGLLAETGTRLTLASGALLLVGIAATLLSAPDMVQTLLYLAAILVGGGPIVREAWEALIEHRRLSIDALVVVAVIGAAILGQWWDAARGGLSLLVQRNAGRVYAGSGAQCHQRSDGTLPGRGPHQDRWAGIYSFRR